MGKIEQFIESLATSKEADKYLDNRPACDSMDEEIKTYAEVAGMLGYDISGEELRAYAEEVTAAHRRKTDQAAEEIRNLPEDELSEVSGGAGHKDCKKTFENRENCWKSDACDNIVNMYNGYICQWFYYLKCEVAKHG